MGKIKILIADDHAVVREGTRQILEQEPDLNVVAEAGDGEEAVRLVGTSKPDVAIIDIRMPGKNGVKILQCIKKEKPDIKVIVITNYPYSVYRKVCMEEGADLFFEKSGDFRTIVNFLDNVSNNKKFLIPVIHHTA